MKMKKWNTIPRSIIALSIVTLLCLALHAMSKPQPDAARSAVALHPSTPIHSDFAAEPYAPGPAVSPERVQGWLELLHTANDGSAVFAKGIANLEQLLASLTPAQPALLPNYPNPFNPETWIPYALAKPADVKVSIYAADGQLVRTLALGHQVPGTYQSKSRAAYWDGRNEFGERVASGVYFYTLEAGLFHATRKMLIIK